MTDNKQVSSLDEAAEKSISDKYGPSCYGRFIDKLKAEFKAGAEWQSQQTKPTGLRCDECNGEGQVEKNIHRGDEGMQIEMDVMVVCSECNGTGLIDHLKQETEETKPVEDENVNNKN